MLVTSVLVTVGVDGLVTSTALSVKTQVKSKLGTPGFRQLFVLPATNARLFWTPTAAATAACGICTSAVACILAGLLMSTTSSAAAAPLGSPPVEVVLRTSAVLLFNAAPPNRGDASDDAGCAGSTAR